MGNNESTISNTIAPITDEEKTSRIECIYNDCLPAYVYTAMLGNTPIIVAIPNLVNEIVESAAKTLIRGSGVTGNNCRKIR